MCASALAKPVELWCLHAGVESTTAVVVETHCFPGNRHGSSSSLAPMQLASFLRRRSREPRWPPRCGADVLTGTGAGVARRSSTVCGAGAGELRCTLTNCRRSCCCCCRAGEPGLPPPLLPPLTCMTPRERRETCTITLLITTADITTIRD